MSYQDRLQTLEYVSPKGNSFELEYDETLTRSRAKKLSVTEFPGQSRASVQDLGVENWAISITCFIQGENYDQKADAFADALLEDSRENGPGLLTHPRWGSIDVITASFEQSEDIVNGAGLATFSITFQEYHEDANDWPDSTDDLLGQIESFADSALSLSKTALATVTLSGATQFSAAFTRMKSRITTAAINFGNLGARFLANDANLFAATQEAQSDLTRKIDTYLQNPSQLIEALTNLYSAPAPARAALTEKTEAYRDAISDLVDQATATEFTEGEGAIHYAQVTAGAIASARTVENGSLRTREDAVSALEYFISIRSLINSYYSTIETESGVSTEFEILKTANGALVAAKKQILRDSLNLPAERVITLDREVTPIQLSYEEYGTYIRADEIIEYNNLSGNEIFMIPRGRKIRLVA